MLLLGLFSRSIPIIGRALNQASSIILYLLVIFDLPPSVAPTKQYFSSESFIAR
jgi:hypothetical protein